MRRDKPLAERCEHREPQPDQSVIRCPNPATTRVVWRTGQAAGGWMDYCDDHAERMRGPATRTEYVAASGHNQASDAPTAPKEDEA